jgi:lipopolysaccharide transport system permease protein
MALREFRTRYAGSALGAIWSIIHPLSLIVIFTVVFSRIMRARVAGLPEASSYAIYLCAGIFPWNCFLETVQRSTTALLDNRNLIQKLRFPQDGPVAWLAVFSTLNGLVTMSLLVVMVLVLRHHIGPNFVLLPVLLALTQLWAFGLGTISAALTVYFRDLAQAVPILFTVWFWMTPIVYMREIVPPRFRMVQALNPMDYALRAFQDAVMYDRWPRLLDLGVLAGTAVVTVLVSRGVLARLREAIPDDI